MKRYLYFNFLLILLFVSCNAKKEEVKVLGITVNDIQKDNINWINEDLGYDIAFQLKDTIQRQDDTLFAYGTHVKLPEFVNKKDAFKELNSQILLDFENDIRSFEHDAKPNPDEYRYIDFKNYIHDSILTVVIKDMRIIHLGEPTSFFQVYHLDFKNNKMLDTKQMFQVLELSQVPILNAFVEQCAYPPDFTEPLFDTRWFDKVKWKNLNLMKFYQNDKNQIVIIYPLAENGLENEQVLE